MSTHGGHRTRGTAQSPAHRTSFGECGVLTRGAASVNRRAYHAVATFDLAAPLDRAIDGYMRRNGYFKVDGGDWALPVDHSVLADCVVALRQHGWPGVFGYMFDEFWMLTRRLHGIVRHVLGTRRRLTSGSVCR